MTWEELNHSRTGKLAAMLLVAVTVLAAWTALTRFNERTEAASPLPGAEARNACAIWFVGSSTMHRWSGLSEDMAPWQTVRRGVDGASFAQLIERFDRDPARIAPRAIVLYAGENDLAAGASPERVFADLQRFVAVVRRMFGPVPVVVLSLKPSPGRWTDRPQQLRYNAAVRQFAEGQPGLTYLEIGPSLMTGDKPGGFFARDGLHLTADGYRRWAPMLDATLRQTLGQAACAG